MSTISASTTSTTAYKVTADTTGTLVFQTGASPTTAMTLGSDQSVTFAGAQTYTGAATFTTGITVQGLTVGKGAGAVSTNTAVGASALAANTSGAYNTVVGASALAANTTGYALAAVGYTALAANTTGTSMVAIGDTALSSNTTGTENTAVGSRALLFYTTGNYNVAVGRRALEGASGTSTGSNNTAVGTQSLFSNTTASNNTAVGYQAGYSNTTGTESTAIGYQALYTNTTGVYSTAVGTQALYASNANSNTGVGYGAGSLITSGAKNTILGRYNGNQGGLDIRTSSNYIVLSDGDGNPRGVFDNSGYFQVTATGLNLGGGTTPSIWRNYGTVGAGMHLSDNSILPTSKTGSISDNTVTWGAASYRWSVIYAANGTINTSDRNEKQDIQDLSAAELAVAQEIKGLFKTFRWKDAVAKKGDAARINVGVIAQDVQAAFANHGLDASRYALWCSDTWYEVDGIGVNNETGMPYTADDVGAVQRTRLGVRYDQLLAFVIAAL